MYGDDTPCVLGNYYSLRSQHEKAVVYFQRALKLNPGYDKIIQHCTIEHYVIAGTCQPSH